MNALGLHAALHDLVRYKRKLFAIIKGSILHGLKQGHGQGFAISRNSLHVYASSL